MIFTVQKFLEKNNFLKRENTFLIGFSSGIDSYCLLDIMVELSKNYHFKVVALHLNHNWRGEESLKEQQRAKEISENYGIPFLTDTLDKNEKITEESARELRYRFFEKCAAKYENCFVMTAHNANDNAETLIYRITKGTGISGLVGIPEVIKKNDVTYLRPLLKIYRDEIENYCNEKNLIPSLDSSNFSTKYKRNLIRNEVLPVLEKINLKVLNAINSLSDLAAENERILDEICKKFMEDNRIILEQYRTASQDIKSRILHKFCVVNGIDYDRRKILDMLNFIEFEGNMNKKYSISQNLWLKFDEKHIFIVSNTLKPEKFEIEINKEDVYKIPIGGCFELKQCKGILAFPNDNDYSAVVDLTGIDFPLTLRNRQDGDIIQPFGMSGKMKLKKYLISKKIPQNKRDGIILLTKGKEVLWVIGVGISNKLRVEKTPTHVLKYNKLK